jgi:hypothetical protein
MTIHAGNQELRFRHGKARPILLPLHEGRGLLQIPSALRLIKDGDVVRRWSLITHILISKVVYVLDERLHATGRLALPNVPSCSAFSLYLVSRKCFLHHRHKRTISREENAVQLAGFCMPGGDI